MLLHRYEGGCDPSIEITDESDVIVRRVVKAAVRAVVEVWWSGCSHRCSETLRRILLSQMLMNSKFVL